MIAGDTAKIIVVFNDIKLVPKRRDPMMIYNLTPVVYRISVAVPLDIVAGATTFSFDMMSDRFCDMMIDYLYANVIMTRRQ